jgi:hypothetical protein
MSLPDGITELTGVCRQNSNFKDRLGVSAYWLRLDSRHGLMRSSTGMSNTLKRPAEAQTRVSNVLTARGQVWSMIW